MHYSETRLGYMIVVSLIALLSTTGAALAECGKVTIGEMNWDSARVIANVEKFILEAGYGCEVELVQTTSVPAMTSMVEKGEPDIASEIWINSVSESFQQGLAEGRIVSAGSVLSDGGVEAWWIPAYFAAAHPEIRTVRQVTENPHLFRDPEEPSKGRFYNCPSGWACKIINTNLVRAYGLSETFNNFDPGSAEGLAGAIAKAHERREPWFGYYWAPTAILGKYPMVMVEMAAFDPEGHACNNRVDCDAPHAGRYPPSEVLAVATRAFAKSHPAEFAFLGDISFPQRRNERGSGVGRGKPVRGKRDGGLFHGEARVAVVFLASGERSGQSGSSLGAGDGGVGGSVIALFDPELLPP